MALTTLFRAMTTPSKAVAIYARGIADAVLAGRADSQTEIVEAAADEEFVEVAAEAEEQPAA